MIPALSPLTSLLVGKPASIATGDPAAFALSLAGVVGTGALPAVAADGKDRQTLADPGKPLPGSGENPDAVIDLLTGSDLASPGISGLVAPVLRTRPGQPAALEHAAMLAASAPLASPVASPAVDVTAAIVPSNAKAQADQEPAVVPEGVVPSPDQASVPIAAILPVVGEPAIAERPIPPSRGAAPNHASRVSVDIGPAAPPATTQPSAEPFDKTLTNGDTPPAASDLPPLDDLAPAVQAPVVVLPALPRDGASEPVSPASASLDSTLRATAQPTKLSRAPTERPSLIQAATPAADAPTALGSSRASTSTSTVSAPVQFAPPSRASASTATTLPGDAPVELQQAVSKSWTRSAPRSLNGPAGPHMPVLAAAITAPAAAMAASVGLPATGAAAPTGVAVDGTTIAPSTASDGVALDGAYVGSSTARAGVTPGGTAVAFSAAPPPIAK